MRRALIVLFSVILGVTTNVAVGLSNVAENSSPITTNEGYQDGQGEVDVMESIKEENDAYQPNDFYLEGNQDLAGEYLDDTKNEAAKDSKEDAEDAYNPDDTDWP